MFSLNSRPALPPPMDASQRQAEIAMSMEALIRCIWDCEAWWRVEDRIDGKIRQLGEVA